MDVHRRLAWHVSRAVEWLRAASSGQLLAPGEPFELPQYPAAGGRRYQIGFSEGPESLQVWAAISDIVGQLDLVRLQSDDDGVLVATAFRSVTRQPLVEPAWGTS